MIQVVCMTLKPQKGAWETTWGRLTLFWSKYHTLYPFYIALKLLYVNKGFGAYENSVTDLFIVIQEFPGRLKKG